MTWSWNRGWPGFLSNIFAIGRGRVGGDCGFTRTGFLKIVPQAYEEQLKANVQMHQEIGINTTLITAAEAKKLAPYLQVDDFNVAAYEPDSGYADPSATTMALMGAARAKGCAPGAGLPGAWYRCSRGQG